MKEFLPYIVTLICTLFSGFASYFASRKQAQIDLQKLERQYQMEIEREREKFEFEMQKMQLEHQHQVEMQQKQFENQMGSDILSSITTEILRSPEGKSLIQSGIKNKRRK